jgi:hypothetical protein
MYADSYGQQDIFIQNFSSLAIAQLDFDWFSTFLRTKPRFKKKKFPIFQNR